MVLTLCGEKRKKQVRKERRIFDSWSYPAIFLDDNIFVSLYKAGKTIPHLEDAGEQSSISMEILCDHRSSSCLFALFDLKKELAWRKKEETVCGFINWPVFGTEFILYEFLFERVVFLPDLPRRDDKFLCWRRRIYSD